MEVMQRKIIKVVSFRNKFDHTAIIFLYFNVLTASIFLNNYMCVLYVYKCLQGGDVFTRYVPERHQTRLAYNNALVVPDLHFRQTVRWRGSQLWNVFPADLCAKQNYDNFKRSLKKYFMYS